jgi:hypothetical protein
MSYENASFDKSQFPAINLPPGEFFIQKDAQGRVVSIEGWVQRQESPRPAEEIKAQKELQEQAPKDKSGNTYYDASHLIPYELGGKGKDNLVLMPSAINKSYVRAIEKEIGKQLDAAPTEKGVYVKVSLTWGESNTVPEKISHEAFVEKSADSLKKVHDSQTKVNWFPEKTLAPVLKDKNYGIDQNTEQYSGQNQPKGLSH